MGTASEEALQRKLRSEGILHRDGVRVNHYLPVIGTREEARLRSTQEVAYRALSLLAVALKAEGLEPQLVEKLVGRYGLAPYFTPKEAVFIGCARPSQSERFQFSWRYEAAWVLLWALKLFRRIGETVHDL